MIGLLTNKETYLVYQTIRDILYEEGMPENLADAKTAEYLAEFEETYESLALFSKLEGPDPGCLIKCTMTDVVMILATSEDAEIRRECIRAWLKILRQTEKDRKGGEHLDLYDRVAFLLESEVRTWFGGSAGSGVCRGRVHREPSKRKS